MVRRVADSNLSLSSIAPKDGTLSLLYICVAFMDRCCASCLLMRRSRQ